MHYNAENESAFCHLKCSSLNATGMFEVLFPAKLSPTFNGLAVSALFFFSFPFSLLNGYFSFKELLVIGNYS